MTFYINWIYFDTQKMQGGERGPENYPRGYLNPRPRPVPAPRQKP